MSTWFTVIVRVASVERIADSAYTNALCMFPEGDRTTPTPEEECWRSFYIAFYGRLLEHGQNYIIFGNARLPGNTRQIILWYFFLRHLLYFLLIL
jgi:hypothetical protein